MLACVTATSPRGELFLTFSIPSRSAQDRANTFKSTRKLPRVVRHLHSPMQEPHNFGQRNELVCYLIYAKLFPNTIINSNTQTYLLLLWGEAAVTQATSILNFWIFQMMNATTFFRNAGKEDNLTTYTQIFQKFLTTIICVPFHFPPGISSWNSQNFIDQ